MWPTLIALALTAAQPWPVQGTVGTLQERFAPPPGYQRAIADPGSYTAFLRALPLRPAGTPVRLFDGRRKGYQDGVAAVIDIDTGARDLQQCADAAIRLRAEYLWSQKRADAACFVAASGKQLRFSGTGYAQFRKWLDSVYTWANTGSLRGQLTPVADGKQPQPGDIWIVGAGAGRAYGHAVTVVDVAVSARGERLMLLAQSYMPAQDLHVLKNLEEPEISPWHRTPRGADLVTPEWTFPADALRRWRGGGACR